MDKGWKYKVMTEVKVKDASLKIIKRIAREVCPDARVILFGSRAKGTAKEDSDYDVIVITKQAISPYQSMMTGSLIRKKLVDSWICADVFINTEQQVNKYTNQVGNIIHDALWRGVEL